MQTFSPFGWNTLVVKRTCIPNVCFSFERYVITLLAERSGRSDRFRLSKRLTSDLWWLVWILIAESHPQTKYSPLPGCISRTKYRCCPHKDVVFAHRCSTCTLLKRQQMNHKTLLQQTESNASVTSGASFCISRRSLMSRSVAAFCAIFKLNLKTREGNEKLFKQSYQNQRRTPRK